MAIRFLPAFENLLINYNKKTHPPYNSAFLWIFMCTVSGRVHFSSYVFLPKCVFLSFLFLFSYIFLLFETKKKVLDLVLNQRGTEDEVIHLLSYC